MMRASFAVRPALPSTSAAFSPSELMRSLLVPFTPYFAGLREACITITTSDKSTSPSPLASAPATVKVNEVEFRVVGTVRHAGSPWGGRGVGDAREYDAYVPLLAAAADGIRLDALSISALPRPTAKARFS